MIKLTSLIIVTGDHRGDSLVLKAPHWVKYLCVSCYYFVRVLFWVLEMLMNKIEKNYQKLTFYWEESTKAITMKSNEYFIRSGEEQ